MGTSKNNLLEDSSLRSNRSIAVVSGKGGSGKTMLTAAFAQVLSMTNQDVTLVDGDVGTGGLSYFLGLRYARNITRGMSDLVIPSLQTDRLAAPDAPIESFLARLGDPLESVLFLPIGDHRALFSLATERPLAKAIRDVVMRLSARSSSPWTIVDCRGGIDQESLAVCTAVDDIILVVETDTTSFQASQHLVEVLTSMEIATKLRGFVINKVFDDPSVISRAGTAAFRCRHLGSIPFDFDTTRDFLVGEVPRLQSSFGIHAWDSLHKAYPESVAPAAGRVWAPRDFREVSLSDVDSSRGGIMAVALLLLLVAVYFMVPMDEVAKQIAAAYAVLIGLMGALERTRRMLGRSISAYVRFLQLLSGSNR